MNKNKDAGCTWLDAFSWRAASAGVLSAFVGFAGSFAIVIQGLTAAGASPAESASALMVLSVAMGVCGIVLSLRSRMPISVAWSTPGAALLASSESLEGGFAAAVGAFMISAVLIIVTGLWKPLGRSIAAIPTPLASAMLAGVLLPLCLAPVQAVAQFPVIGLAVVVTWVVVGRLNKLFAVPAAVVVAGLLIWMTTDLATPVFGSLWSSPVLVTPIFSLASVVGIGLPLFIVTMASQNIPGIAVLNTYNYRPDPGPLFSVTGLFSLVAAPFGGHAINLAAITAAICAGDDAHPDSARRYWAAVVAGGMYIVFGLCAGAAVAFISVSPPIVIEAVAGLALIGALTASLIGAIAVPEDREAALITFLVTASGVVFFGIGGAFWGLLAGGAMYALSHR